MLNELASEQNNFLQKKIQKRNRKRKQILKSKKHSSFFKLTCICAVTICAFSSTHDLCISSNCKDLSYAVEYYLTHGISSKDKLMRVQTMSLISHTNDTAVVEAYGLSKSEPHKNISVKGNFKKNTSSSWYLESMS